MATLETTDRFVFPTQDMYVFLAPSGEVLQCLGLSPNTQFVDPVTLPLYTFVYVDALNTLQQLEVNKDLQVIYVNGVLQVEPFLEVSYSFKEVKFSILLSTNDAESKFKYNTPIHISENQASGTTTENNYYKAEEIFKDRLLGAINLRFTRNQDGLLSVDACVVNKGVVPDWS